MSGDVSPKATATLTVSNKAAQKVKNKAARSGIVYMSRVPPHLKPLKLRQLLEGYATLGRIYMAPKERAPGAKAGARQGKQFSEAWIEFEDKKLGRAVAEMLNGNAIGGKARSRYHDDLWTLKYLPKFKWDHLTEEVGACRAPAATLVLCAPASAARRCFMLCLHVRRRRPCEALCRSERELPWVFLAVKTNFGQQAGEA